MIEGVCYLGETLQVNGSDSGLTIRGTAGATLVGGQPLVFSGAWRRSALTPANRTAPHSIWERSLKANTAPATLVRSLRIAEQAATLARYPNADPERDIYPTGWINDAARSRWLAPNLTDVGVTVSAIESRPWLVRNDTL